MSDTSGGFHSAEDADSVPPERAGDPAAHKTEGAFYLWRDEEIAEALESTADIFRLRFGVLPGGNAPQDPQGEFTGLNLLYAARGVKEIAETTGSTPDEVADALLNARERLYAIRAARPRPDRDDKIVTAWNGLMIAAFARGARVLAGGRLLAEPTPCDAGAAHLASAERAAMFLRERMWDADRRVLLRRFRAGQAAIDGYAEDYAYLIFGLLELFQANGDPRWLSWAVELQARQDEVFWDPVDGGWFATSGGDASVLLRMKEEYDGAEPAASSVAVLNLLTLSHLTGGAEYEPRIAQTLRLFGARLTQSGRAVPMMAAALATWLARRSQVVVVGAPDDAVAREMREALAATYLPFTVVVPVNPGQSPRELAERIPWIGAMTRREGRATAYVCRDFACEAPATDVATLGAALGALVPAE